MIQFPDRIDAAGIFLFRGAILGIITSGNVHNFRTWTVALGNFAFYFGIAYLAYGIWERHRSKIDASKEG